MKTYQDYLESQEWKVKRNHIIHRDNQTCEQCGNKVLLKDHLCGKLSFDRVNEEKYAEYFLSHNSIRYKYYLPISLNLPQAPLFVLFKIINDHILVLTARQYNPIEDLLRKLFLYTNQDESTLRDIVKSSLGYSDIETDNLIYNWSKPYLFNASDWLFVGGLNVHHEYYQDGKLPWEYPDESLHTLCSECHLIHHQNHPIEHRDTLGNKIGFFAPCIRCNGTGYLPEFHYYQNGICFTCNGLGYLVTN
ncbi:MAG: hypothetical protein IPH88_06500 [Bacteroidales bacterium]|nr:hypothetical protein [Bacteroidales bacterium]